jgi:hypothetical protein
MGVSPGAIGQIMLQTNTTTYPSGSPLALLDALPSRLLPPDARIGVRHERQSELAIDDVLAGSFPASDPPAWNPGMARPVPVHTSRDDANDIRPSTAREETAPGAAGVINVSPRLGSEPTLRQALMSLAGASGIALLAPFAILLVGLPIALAGRGLIEVLAWLFPAFR